jgi:hypothetical protein
MFLGQGEKHLTQRLGKSYANSFIFSRGAGNQDAVVAAAGKSGCQSGEVPG